MTAKLIDDCFVLDKDRLPHKEAIGILQTRIHPVTASELVPLNDASGRYAAESIVAPRPIPGHDNAAVDGYAFAFADYDTASGTAFQIVGEVAAGHPYDGQLAARSAVRIFTGAVMPEGSDSVAMQEDVQVEDRDGALWASIPPGLKAGANRRLAGEDTTTGDTLVSAEIRLRPQDVASAAAAGCSTILCRVPLKVAVFSTGDEILRPGEPFVEGKVYDANASMLHGLVATIGAEAIDLGVLPDTRSKVTAALSQASKNFDAIVISGGASQGQEDHVVASIDTLGKRHLWQIAIKPGRPMSFGQIGDCVVLGLPGNPVAVFVCFLMYVRPVLMRLSGGTWPEPARFPIVSNFSQKKKVGRREFWRARLVHQNGQLTVSKFERDGSGLISSLRESDGLIELAEEVDAVVSGELVDFIPYSELGLV